LCTHKLINHISIARALSTARQEVLKLEQEESACTSFSMVLLSCAEFPIGKAVLNYRIMLGGNTACLSLAPIYIYLTDHKDS